MSAGCYSKGRFAAGKKAALARRPREKHRAKPTKRSEFEKLLAPRNTQATPAWFRQKRLRMSCGLSREVHRLDRRADRPTTGRYPPHLVWYQLAPLFLKPGHFGPLPDPAGKNRRNPEMGTPKVSRRMHALVPFQDPENVGGIRRRGIRRCRNRHALRGRKPYHSKAIRLLQEWSSRLICARAVR